ncbi:MAG: AraC family transcriptional regulator [Alistipes sp.]|nr:AraC family transcriptional regulator [Alistipes sp.]
MHNVEQPEIVRVVENQSTDVTMIRLSRLAVGMVFRGVKIVHHNDHCTKINPGMLFLLDQGVHYIEHRADEDGFEQVVFYISESELQNIILNLSSIHAVDCHSSHSCDECRHHNFVVERPSAMVADLFRAVHNSCRLKEFRQDKVTHMLRLSELVYQIFSGEDSCLRSHLAAGADMYNAQFARQIYDSIFADTSIERLAEQTNRSLTSFKKEFYRQFDTSPHKWFVTQRLERAKILLLSTTKTISEIGADCAFTNISHFIKLFKSRYHTTPALYRKHNNAKKQYPH